MKRVSQRIWSDYWRRTSISSQVQKPITTQRGKITMHCSDTKCINMNFSMWWTMLLACTKFSQTFSRYFRNILFKEPIEKTYRFAQQQSVFILTRITRNDKCHHCNNEITNVTFWPNNNDCYKTNMGGGRWQWLDVPRQWTATASAC